MEPNSVEEAFDHAGTANGQPLAEGTVENPTSNGAVQEAEPVIDYKEKFSASTREAQRLAAENAAKDAEIERLRSLAPEPGTPSETLFPGFEELGEEEQRNLLQFKNTMLNEAKQDLYKDPAIAFAKRTYNEKKFNEALERVAGKLPELKGREAEFKEKYYNPDNVPDNIETILVDVGKAYLYDYAKDLGAKEGREQAERIDLERSSGGQGSQVTTSRTLEEWQRLQQENPAKFAALSKEYHADLEAGKLKE